MSFVFVFLALATVPDELEAKKKKNSKNSKAAAAQADEEQLAARQHYEGGQKLYDDRQFAEALVEFQAAYDAKPHPVVLKSIAECKFQLEDYRGAQAILEQYLADPESTGKDQVAARVEEIKTKYSVLQITTEPLGAKIMVDGEDVDAVTPTSVDVTPGEHEVSIEFSGYQPAQRQVAVMGGETVEVSVDFAKEGVPLEPAMSDSFGGGLIDPFADGEDEPSGDEAGSEIETEEDGAPPAFWACAAITGVGLVAGTVFGTMALTNEEDYKNEPKQDTKDEGTRNALIADVSFGVAAAAAVVGTIILIAGSHEESESEDGSVARFDVTPVAGAETVGVNAVVTF